MKKSCRGDSSIQRCIHMNGRYCKMEKIKTWLGRNEWSVNVYSININWYYACYIHIKSNTYYVLIYCNICSIRNKIYSFLVLGKQSTDQVSKASDVLLFKVSWYFQDGIYLSYMKIPGILTILNHILNIFSHFSKFKILILFNALF